MNLAVDRSAYATAPRISLASGLSLVEQLIAATPANASRGVKESVAGLKKTAASARTVHQEATDLAALPQAAGDAVLDNRADRCLAGIRTRLEGWTLLDDAKEAKRAAGLIVRLFPEGLGYTRRSFDEQDQEMKRLLERVKARGIKRELDELVGPPFLATLKKLAKAYSAMVAKMGTTQTRQVAVRETVVALQTMIVRHASRVLGELDDDDPKSVEATRAMLAPLDNFRARAAQRGSKKPSKEAPVIVAGAARGDAAKGG